MRRILGGRGDAIRQGILHVLGALLMYVREVYARGPHTLASNM